MGLWILRQGLPINLSLCVCVVSELLKAIFLGNFRNFQIALDIYTHKNY